MRPLLAKAPYTDLVRERGVFTWEELKATIASLPYARTSFPQDLTLVMREGCGTCSGKHAYLVCVARENSIPDVHLMVSAVKMSAESSPKIRPVLEKFRLAYIPEAHCYLQERGRFEDYTRPGKHFDDFKSRILDTSELKNPERVAIEKTAYHQAFLRTWLSENSVPYSFEELWQIRELCIVALSDLGQSAEG